MSLKKYLTYSFITLWTVVLIIALIASIIHQIRFQDSATHLNLNREVASLEFQNAQLEGSLYKREQEIIKMLNTPYYE
jgi:hypothetical protein|tara:strand:+ start:346 stop:579 length:234 start_codon:yes stop_codon:yes gene_type:complete